MDSESYCLSLGDIEKLLLDVGFHEATYGNTEPGNFNITPTSNERDFIVYLEGGVAEIKKISGAVRLNLFKNQGGGFYYSDIQKIFKYRHSLLELKNFLLMSIIRDSFFTDEEELDLSEAYWDNHRNHFGDWWI